MLTSEQIVQKLESQKAEIARQIAETMQKRQVAHYANTPISQIEQAVLPSINMILNYFRTDDTTALKTDIQNRAATSVSRGITIESLQSAIEVIATVIEQAIERITVGDTTSASVIAKYKSRVESIKTLSKISVVNNKLKQEF